MRFLAITVCSLLAFQSIGRIHATTTKEKTPVIIELPLQADDPEDFILSTANEHRTGAKYLILSNSYSARFYTEKGILRGTVASPDKNNIAFFPVENGMATARLTHLSDGKPYLFKLTPHDQNSASDARFPTYLQGNAANIFNDVTSMMFFDNDQMIILGYKNGDIKSYDLTQQRERIINITLIGHLEGSVITLANLGGGQLGAGSDKGHVKVWAKVAARQIPLSDFTFGAPVQSLFKSSAPINDKGHLGLAVIRDEHVQQPPFGKLKLNVYSFSTFLSASESYEQLEYADQFVQLNAHSFVYQATENEPDLINEDFATKNKTVIFLKDRPSQICPWDGKIILWQRVPEKNIYRLEIIEAN